MVFSCHRNQIILIYVDKKILKKQKNKRTKQKTVIFCFLIRENSPKVMYYVGNSSCYLFIFILCFVMQYFMICAHWVVPVHSPCAQPSLILTLYEREFSRKMTFGLHSQINSWKDMTEQLQGSLSFPCATSSWRSKRAIISSFVLAENLWRTGE